MLKKNNLVVKIFLPAFALAFLAIACNKEAPQSQEEQKPEPAAIVTFIMGDVTVAYPDSTQIFLSINDKIKTGAMIEAAAKSFATIQINEVGIIRINEKSRLEINDILSKDKGTSLNLTEGSVFSKIIKKPDTKYNVQTPTMVAAVRGTQFLTIASGNSGQVLVKEGIVNVSTDSDSDGKDVVEKKRVVVDKKGEIKLAFQNKLQELTLEKYALDPYIDDIENKNPEEMEEMFRSKEPEEKKIDKKIEEVKIMMLSPLDRLRKAGKPLVELYLKDGSEIIGSIEKTTDTSLSLNTGEGLIDIPKSDIKRRVSTK